MFPKEDWSSYSKQYIATQTRHMDQLCSRINSSRLCTRASALRHGTPCTVDLSQKHLTSMMGGQNCHAEVIFEDSVRWLVRIRLERTNSPPQNVRDYVFRSEVATMLYLSRHTAIPVPRVYDWACGSDNENDVGVSYILMEMLEGKPLNWQAANPEQREKVMQQLADVWLEIDRHPFKSMGSLLNTDSSVKFDLGGIAQPTTYRTSAGGPLGPFQSASEGLVATLNLYLSMIANEEICANNQVNAYLAHRFRIDIVAGLGQEDGVFFLKHQDDKGDHIMVNDAYDIVGIIDWEWTRTASKAEAFSSPCMMWPIGEFYDGSNILSQEEIRFAEILQERGRQDLSGCVLQGREIQRLLFALATECPSDHNTFVSLLMGLRSAFASGSVEETWDQWKEKALLRWKDDEMLQALV